LISLALLAIFGAQVWLAATQPVTSAEAYLYECFVRPPLRQVLNSESLNRDVLYALLEKRSIGLLHTSEFSIRLPSLMFWALYLWILRRLLRRSAVLLLAAALAPMAWSWFSTARGTGMALALLLCGVERLAQYLQSNPSYRLQNLNWAGACLGLSVAADLRFLIPATVLLVAFLFKGQWSLAINRLFIPALVAAFVPLVLPLSHARAVPSEPPALTRRETAQVRSIAHFLCRDAGANPIHIAAGPVIQPMLSFYRSRFRASNWDFEGPTFDYSVEETAEAGVILTRRR